MGRRFGQDQCSMGVKARSASLAGLLACLCGALAIAGCGEGSGKASTSAASAATTASTATTPTTSTSSTTPKTTSTASKPPASKSSTTTTQATTTKTTPPAKPSTAPATRPGKPTKNELGFGKIKVTSAAFKAGGPIAVKYTCDGAGTSPPMQLQGIPRGTAEVFMLAIDLSGSTNDAIQWAVAGIPPNATEIPEGSLPPGAVAGLNSAGKVGWGGICGAKGKLHHVGFLLYALKHKLGLKSGFNAEAARRGLRDSLATGLTLALYQRP